MLYTLSKSHYDDAELADLFRHFSEQDVLVLWQDGVLQAVKKPDFFANKANIFLLENDVKARALNTELPQLSLAEFVRLSECYFPHFSL